MSSGQPGPSSRPPAHANTRSSRPDDGGGRGSHSRPGGTPMRLTRVIFAGVGGRRLDPRRGSRGDGRTCWRTRRSRSPRARTSSASSSPGGAAGSTRATAISGSARWLTRGKHSCLLFGGIGAKIRVAQNVELSPGRYRVTAYLRGLDIGTGTYNTTTEFMFDGKYQQLNKNGTFGWTRLTYVGEIKEKKQAGPSFGLMAPGYFWIDDVTLETVGDDVPLTENPVLGNEEAPIAPPGEIPATRRSLSANADTGTIPAGETCYACGTALAAQAAVAARPARQVDRLVRGPEPLLRRDRGRRARHRRAQGAAARPRVRQHGPAPELAGLRLPQGRPVYRGHASRWICTSRSATTATRDYWTRVNYATVVPPGEEHADHPGQATLRGREIAARADARPGPDHPARLRHRRHTRRAALPGQPPPRARRLAGPRRLRGPPCVRLRHQHQPGDGGVHRDHAADALQPGPRLRPQGRPGSGAPSTRSSPIRSTRTSSASRPAAWRSTCPTATIGSSSTSTAPPASGASTRPTASAPSSPRAGRS